MERHIRNQAIAEAHEAGEPIAELAARFELKPASVKRILKDFEIYKRIQDEEKLPDGISLVAAVTIVQAIGIWPDSSNFDDILKRRIEIMRSGGRGRLVTLALAEIERAKSTK